MFENEWFVGIAAGVISGLLLILINKLVIDKVSMKEYWNKVNEVNREVINLVTAGDKIPNNAVLKFPIYQG